MKKLFAIIVIALTTGCGMRHQPIDFTEIVVITDIETDFNGENRLMGCLYHAVPTRSGQQDHLNMNQGWFFDSCYKYKIGDTITLNKKQ